MNKAKAGSTLLTLFSPLSFEGLYLHVAVLCISNPDFIGDCEQSLSLSIFDISEVGSSAVAQ